MRTARCSHQRTSPVVTLVHTVPSLARHEKATATNNSSSKPKYFNFVSRAEGVRCNAPFTIFYRCRWCITIRFYTGHSSINGCYHSSKTELLKMIHRIYNILLLERVCMALRVRRIYTTACPLHTLVPQHHALFYAMSCSMPCNPLRQYLRPILYHIMFYVNTYALFYAISYSQPYTPPTYHSIIQLLSSPSSILHTLSSSIS